MKMKKMMKKRKTRKRRNRRRSTQKTIKPNKESFPSRIWSNKKGRKNKTFTKKEKRK